MKTGKLNTWFGRIVVLGAFVAIFGAFGLEAQPRQAQARAASGFTTSGSALLLLEAVQAGDLETVRELVLGGVDVNSVVENEGTALIVAARSRNLAMVNELLLLGANVTLAARGDGNPLIAASSVGSNVTVIERLLSAGAVVNAVVPGDETALINASRSGSLANVKSLVEHGADVNLAVITELGVRRSPLNQAKVQAVRDYLIAHGARP
ncbi:MULTISPECIES: ankyrin repeat domain-containing protein [Lysobacter]|jgi:ankyrin repeat protein|uniref:ankyrin repeat domain-containing protein n=1 Tax=Lysobacter TaxID=68 RepID=UPI001F1F1B3A|nr:MULTISPECIES: ankyrin repeat domain-containing protein [Lysobacter]UJB20540.1 ankyrin repeat domain-containing protein [Lysobacter capsici]UJQ30346.1 ankyrin repeat domain-containing protein [Lysobacter gummosus]